MIMIKQTNDKQREMLAQFYSNLALAWLTFGLISPFFVGMSNPAGFVLKFIASLGATIFSLKIALDFLK